MAALNPRSQIARKVLNGPRRRPQPAGGLMLGQPKQGTKHREEGDMEFGVLGPLEARGPEGPLVSLGGIKQRALLAVLLLRANEVVSRDSLIDGLWGDRPPASALHGVEVYVSRLRKTILAGRASDGQALLTRPPGYMLQLQGDELDLHRFERLVAEGKRAAAAGKTEVASQILSEALALWRGEPLQDLALLPFAAAEIDRLEQRRLAALEERIDTDLALGRQADVVDEIQGLVTKQPLRERLHGQLMISLYRCGRQAEALRVFQELRYELVKELGIEPGSDLRQLQEEILRQDPRLDRAKSSIESMSTGQLAPPIFGPNEQSERQAHTPRGEALRDWRAPLVGSRAARAISLIVALGAIAAFLVVRGTDNPVAPLDGNAFVVVDPQTGELTSQWSSATAATGVASGEGSIWTSNFGAHTVSRVDVATHSTRETIEVGSGPSGIAVGAGHVWVANSLDATLSRIDPETNQVVQTISVGNGPSGVAYGEGSIWVANARDRTVTRIDAATGRVRNTVDLASSPTDVAFEEETVWVTSDSGNTLSRINPQTNDVVHTINVGTGANGLAAKDGAVWVANSLDGTVSRIDARKNTVIATIPVGGGPREVVVADEAVWVSNEFDGTLSHIDPRTNEVVRTIRLGSHPEDLSMVEGSLWVALSASGTGHRGGTLILQAETPRFESVDPAIVIELFPPMLLDMTNDGLVSLKHVGGSDGTHLVPNLALSLPTPSDGGTTYTFELRPGIRYSTGALVSPEDFRHALERTFKLSSPGTDYFRGIAGGSACVARPQTCDLSKGIVTDRQTNTVTFHLTEPDPDFLYKLTLPFAYAIPVGTPNPDIGTTPVPATGPYMIRSYEPGKRLRLVRNPSFHEWSKAAQPDGYPDEIVWRLGIDPQDAVTAIERGKADWMLSYFAPPGNRLSEIETRYASQVHLDPLMATDYFVLNTDLPPFDDVRVRRALNFAIDRRAIVRSRGGSNIARPTCQVLPPNLPGHEPYCPYTVRPSSDGEWIAPDLAKARSLVKASGTTGMRVEVVADRFGVDAPHVVSALRRIGYQASLRVVPSQRYNQFVSDPRNKVQVSAQGWVADYPSASNFIALFLRCGARSNHSGFCAPDIDKRIDRALTLQATDAQRAGKLWAKLDKAIVDQAPWVPTVTPLFVGFVSQRVGNYQFHPQWGPLIDQLWVGP